MTLNDMVKNLILWMTIAAVMLFLFQNFSQPTAPDQLIYSDLIREVRAGQVEEVTINDIEIIGKNKNGMVFKTIRPLIQDPKLMDDLYTNNVRVIGAEPKQQSIWEQLLIASFPILIIIAVFMFFMRQ